MLKGRRDHTHAQRLPAGRAPPLTSLRFVPGRTSSVSLWPTTPTPIKTGTLQPTMPRANALSRPGRKRESTSPNSTLRRFATAARAPSRETPTDGPNRYGLFDVAEKRTMSGDASTAMAQPYDFPNAVTRPTIDSRRLVTPAHVMRAWSVWWLHLHFFPLGHSLHCIRTTIYSAPSGDSPSKAKSVPSCVGRQAGPVGQVKPPV